MSLSVPSLQSLCVLKLIPFVDNIHLFPLQLNRRCSLDDLISDPADIDPRLWAVLIHVWSNLPPYLATCSIDRNDPHLPLLQAIPPSPHFSLVTELHLSSCPQVNDVSIIHLASLHNLAALDASHTKLSANGIQSLSGTLQLNPIRGPWPLRILYLRNCEQITDVIFPLLIKFPLLSVVDLRATQCKSCNDNIFTEAKDSRLYHPSSLSQALDILHTQQPKLYSSHKYYTLRVKGVDQPAPRSVSTVAPQDAFFVLSESKVITGNVNILAQREEHREKELIHERNKDAWYERQDRPFNTWGHRASVQIQRPSNFQVEDPHTARNAPVRKDRTQIQYPTSPTNRSLLPTKPDSLRNSRYPFSASAGGSVVPISAQVNSKKHSPLSSPKISTTNIPALHKTNEESTRTSKINFTLLSPIVHPTTVTKTRPVPPNSQYPNTALGNRDTPAVICHPWKKLSTPTKQVYNNPTALMLFRSPPPWSALTNAITATQLREEEVRKRRIVGQHLKQSQVAALDAKKISSIRQQMEETMNQQIGTRTKRRKTEFPQATFASESSSANRSRNPFLNRRKSFDSSKTALSANHAHDAAKALIPISSVKVPTLPPSTVIKSKGSANVSSRKSQGKEPASSIPNGRTSGRIQDFDWGKWAKRS